MYRFLAICRAAQWACFYSLLALTLSEELLAGTTTIAITGDASPGVVGGEFGNLFAGPINEQGEFVFTTDLSIGPGGVTSSDDQGVWLFDGTTTTTLVAREGSGGVPDALGANFQSFATVSVDTAGDVAFRATLEDGVGGVTSTSNQGIWSYPGGSGEVVARTGSMNVPDVIGADFGFLPATLRIAGDGRIVQNGSMTVAGSITSLNDKGVWSYSSGAGTMLARETESTVPEVAGADYLTFGKPSINSNNQVVFSSSLYINGLITSSNRLGIWQYTDSTGALLARTGVGNVPDIGGANFTAFNDPRQNTDGQVAFIGTVNVANNRGAWLYTEGVGELMGRSGVGGVPDVAGANFSDFDSLLLNDAGQVLVQAELEVGLGGVTATNNSGLWFLDGGGSLAIRTGSGGVPDLPGANFLEITNFALNENGQLAVAATLEDGVGGVDTSNDTGLWTIDPGGDSHLIAREGDLLAGHTIDSLSFVGDSGGNDDQPSGFNALGHLIYAATFTNGDSGLFLFDFDSLEADFDSNTMVDDADLAAWEGGFGLSSGATFMQGDSDGDFDVDGVDFLTWQRQRGMGVSPLFAAAAVPEPRPALLVSIAIGCCLVLRQPRK